jgi:hypothetical protein
MSLPPHIRAQAQRILDAEARRLLAQLDPDAPSTATTGHDDTGDDRLDQPASRRKTQRVPVVQRRDLNRRPKAA